MEKDKLEQNIEKLADHFEKANFAEYVDLLSKPWKMFWLNFLVGLFRGLGTAAGMTIIFGLVVYMSIHFLANFVQIPIIGSYIAQLVDFVNQSLKSR